MYIEFIEYENISREIDNGNLKKVFVHSVNKETGEIVYFALGEDFSSEVFMTGSIVVLIRDSGSEYYKQITQDQYMSLKTISMKTIEDKANDILENNKMIRQGQALMIASPDVIYKILRGTGVDCFYLDDRINGFIEAVKFIIERNNV